MSRENNQLEVAIRIRSQHGWLRSEHIIRGGMVELIEFFPSGKIAQRTDVTLDRFITELAKLEPAAFQEDSQ